MRGPRGVLAIVGLVVLVAGVGYAASQSLTSKKLTVLTAPAPSTGPKATALSFTDADGNPEKNDTFTVTYSETMSVSSFCSTWASGNTSNYTISGDNVVGVTIEDNAASGSNDRLVVTVTSAACGGSFSFGSLNLNIATVVSGSSATFKGTTTTGQSKIEWFHSTRTLKVTFGALAAGSVDDINGNHVVTYNPDTANLKSASGVAITSDTASNPSNTKPF